MTRQATTAFDDGLALMLARFAKGLLPRTMSSNDVRALRGALGRAGFVIVRKSATWQPIDDGAKTGAGVLLGATGSPHLGFYHWNEEPIGNQRTGWSNVAGAEPRTPPTHYMRIEPPG